MGWCVAFMQSMEGNMNHVVLTSRPMKMLEFEERQDKSLKLLLYIHILDTFLFVKAVTVYSYNICNNFAVVDRLFLFK